MKRSCDCDELDIDDALAAQIPSMIDAAIATALREHTRPTTRHDEIDMSDAQLARVMRDLPNIVRGAFHAAVAEEVRLAMRRLQGKVD